MGIFQGLLGLEDGVNIGERTAGGFWRRAEEVTRRISGSYMYCAIERPHTELSEAQV